MKTKTCRKCSRELSVAEFGRHGRSADGLSSHCKPCKRAHDNAAYADRSTGRAQRVGQTRANARMRNESIVRQFRRLMGCVECDSKDPEQLTLQREDGRRHVVSISRLAQHGYSLSRIADEIEQSVVICRRCDAASMPRAKKTNAFSARSCA